MNKPELKCFAPATLLVLELPAYMDDHFSTADQTLGFSVVSILGSIAVGFYDLHYPA
jgi:hypothetical protein